MVHNFMNVCVCQVCVCVCVCIYIYMANLGVNALFTLGKIIEFTPPWQRC